MNKLVRVFASQVFNSFFPLLIVAILLYISDKSVTAPIFIIINFANTYLLFSDYSSNLRFVKESMRLGGISKNTPLAIETAINHYIGIKSIVLGIGIIPWIIICYFSPALHQHIISSIIGYIFIVAYNLNFYWIYTTSRKEYFFILSNLFSRLTLVTIIFLCIYFHFNYAYILFWAGLAGLIISLLFFLRFCQLHNIRISFNKNSIRSSAKIIVSDVKLVTSNFTLMMPSLCLTFFLSYVKEPGQIVTYAIAEKLFLGVRTLLSIAINSAYPILCDKKHIKKAILQQMGIIFFGSVIIVLAFTYWLSPFLLHLIHSPAIEPPVFQECLQYFLIVLGIISINAPFMLWLMVSGELQTKRTLLAFSVAAVLTLIIFVGNALTLNSVVSLVQSLMISEATIVLTFLFLYKYRRSYLSSQTIVPAV